MGRARGLCPPFVDKQHGRVALSLLFSKITDVRLLAPQAASAFKGSAIGERIK